MQYKIVNKYNEEQNGNFVVTSNGRVVVSQSNWDVKNDLIVSWNTQCQDTNGNFIYSNDILVFDGDNLTFGFDEGAWRDCEDEDTLNAFCGSCSIKDTSKLTQLIELLGQEDGKKAYEAIS